MDKAREEMLIEHRVAQAYNDAIEKAGWRVWELRNEGRYVLALTEKEIRILRESLGGELTGKKLAIRNHIDEALDDEDSTGLVVDAILALTVPFWPDRIEWLFKRRDALLDKQTKNYTWPPRFENLTKEEQAEYTFIKKELEQLPYGWTVKDQEARDYIHDSVALLKKHS